MKVRITKYSDSLFWYASQVGEVYQVRRIDSDRYWVRERNDWGAWNFILFVDCVEYKEVN